MLARQGLKLTVGLGQMAVRKNLATTAVAAQKASDPIQQLFVDKVREYAQKKSAAGGKLVDATPAIEKNLQKELDKVAAQYGGASGVDMTKFPDLKFAEPQLDAAEVN